MLFYFGIDSLQHSSFRLLNEPNWNNLFFLVSGMVQLSLKNFKFRNVLFLFLSLFSHTYYVPGKQKSTFTTSSFNLPKNSVRYCYHHRWGIQGSNQLRYSHNILQTVSHCCCLGPRFNWLYNPSSLLCKPGPLFREKGPSGGHHINLEGSP